MKGYVQVYTGNGKGKTTAALGLALRASGAGLSVFIGQFIKGKGCSELQALNEVSNVTIEQFGHGRFIKDAPTQEDISAGLKGLKKVKEAVTGGNYDVVIADEANCAVSTGLFGVEKLIEIIDEKPENVEVVFTGRGADALLVERADLVTEMKEVKHYFDDGVAAREGIES